ncbi:MAG: hypothetical protein PHH11_16175 [Methylomonas sp.]|nr:hypothetical protein [Methylomonas sp.]
MNARFMLLLALLPLSSSADDLFSIELPECTARLERRSVEAGVALVRSGCSMSLRSLAKLLEEGLQGLFPEGLIAIRSIYLGRLMDYPEWSRTLATSAALSPEWDTRRGKPRSRHENDNSLITRLLNGPAYPDELRPVLADYGLKLCISDVEKVLVFEANDVFTADQLMTKDLNPKFRLPFDAQVWLTLQPITFDCAHRT